MHVKGASEVLVGWGLGAEAEEVLGSFVQKSVTRGTMTKYAYGWNAWCKYGDLYGWSDYYMTTASRTEKVRHVMNFFRLRWERGLREK
jgi:hypothetical protein